MFFADGILPHMQFPDCPHLMFLVLGTYEWPSNTVSAISVQLRLNPIHQIWKRNGRRAAGSAKVAANQSARVKWAKLQWFFHPYHSDIVRFNSIQWFSRVYTIHVLQFNPIYRTIKSQEKTLWFLDTQCLDTQVSVFQRYFLSPGDCLEDRRTGKECSRGSGCSRSHWVQWRMGALLRTGQSRYSRYLSCNTKLIYLNFGFGW